MPKTHPHVYVSDEFEYNRAMRRVFAMRLAAVEAFVNGMLDAFEEGKGESKPSRRVQI